MSVLSLSSQTNWSLDDKAIISTPPTRQSVPPINTKRLPIDEYFECNEAVLLQNANGDTILKSSSGLECKFVEVIKESIYGQVIKAQVISISEAKLSRTRSNETVPLRNEGARVASNSSSPMLLSTPRPLVLEKDTCRIVENGVFAMDDESTDLLESNGTEESDGGEFMTITLDEDDMEELHASSSLRSPSSYNSSESPRFPTAGPLSLRTTPTFLQSLSESYSDTPTIEECREKSYHETEKSVEFVAVKVFSREKIESFQRRMLRSNSPRSPRKGSPRSAKSNGLVCLEDPISELEISRIVAINANGRNCHLLGSLECCGNDSHFFNVMPFVQAPELFDVIAIDETGLSEPEVVNIVIQLAEGLSAMHSHNIAHRDISLENVLYDPISCNTWIIDFGLGVIVDESISTKTNVPDTDKPSTPSSSRAFGGNRKSFMSSPSSIAGSPSRGQPYSSASGQVSRLVPNIFTGKIAYLAPEVVQGTPIIDPFAGDVWALGICCLYLLLGFPPFYRADDSDVRYLYLKRGRLSELLGMWGTTISPSAVEFLEFILQVDPIRRPTIEQVLAHRWLQTKVT